jgi:hypothetical protein
MRAFGCDVCGNLLVPENSVCVSCGTAQGFSPAAMRLVPVDGRQQCANLGPAGCNWLVDDADGPLCRSCRLTRTRPAEDDPEGLAAWATTETAKRRLVYQLLDLGLQVRPWSAGPGPDGVPGLAFDLLSSTRTAVTTGHADGVVTIDLAEGQDAHREAMRVQMGEPYRTLLGHLRHETGHYYWQVLAHGPALDRLRETFGDERADYGQALQRHYAEGPPAGWAQEHVSAYATAHPWEDWAETFAHYLHLRDTLQTAAAYGMVVTGPDLPGRDLPDRDPAALVALPLDDAGRDRPFDELVATWLPLSYALNAVNRSMGKGDLYPFVLTPAVIGKLALVHDLVQDRAQDRTQVGAQERPQSGAPVRG